MTSTVGLTDCDRSGPPILKADAFCSRPGTIALGRLVGWEQVHPTASSHDRPTKRSRRGLAMEPVVGMATSGRRAVRLEVG